MEKIKVTLSNPNVEITYFQETGDGLQFGNLPMFCDFFAWEENGFYWIELDADLTVTPIMLIYYSPIRKSDYRYRFLSRKCRISQDCFEACFTVITTEAKTNVSE